MLRVAAVLLRRVAHVERGGLNTTAAHIPFHLRLACQRAQSETCEPTALWPTAHARFAGTLRSEGAGGEALQRTPSGWTARFESVHAIFRLFR